MNGTAEAEVTPAKTRGQGVHQVHSNRFGHFTVPEEQVLRFPEGLIGFPDYHKFVIMEHPTPNPLRWLLCLDEPDLAFAVADPDDFFAGSEVWPQEQMQAFGVGVDGSDDIAVFAIVTIPSEHPSGMSVNLMAPIVVNVRTRIAYQVILDTDLCSTRHLLLGEPIER